MVVFNGRAPAFSNLLGKIESLADNKEPITRMNHSLFTESGYDVKIHVDNNAFAMDQRILDATILKVQGDYKTAILQYEMLVKEFPEDGFPYRIKLAECYYKVGRIDDAETQLSIIDNHECTPACCALGILIGKNGGYYQKKLNDFYDHPASRL
jgi:tetratricopeptide (TPR) repeat protein